MEGSQWKGPLHVYMYAEWNWFAYMCTCIMRLDISSLIVRVFTVSSLNVLIMW